MATEFFLVTLLRTQVAASVAILLVLGLRRSARRWVGPVLCYRLWGLVPAALVSAVMPGLAEWMNGGVVHLGADASPAGPSMLRAFTLLDVWRQTAPALFGVWSAGAVCLALLFAAAEARFRRKAARGLAGPALVGIAAPRLVVPADFRRRYDERERALIRRHERTHMEQNHPLANLALAVFQVVGWFNPLCHVAAVACRLDQEMACDALVLEGRRRDRRLYAHALLKAHRAWPALDVIRAATAEADGVIHTAFGLDFSKMAELSEEERAAIETFGEVFSGSARPIIVTGGLALLPPGETFTEESRPAVIPDFPRASEQTAFGLAERGLHASVVRLSRSVHGLGERHGFIPMLAAVAREKGVSAYVGEGRNVWLAVHRLDAARLFRLALERGGRNEAYHAVAENLPFKPIAEAIGRQLGVPVKSLTPEEAQAHFGPLAMWVAGGGPASSEWTRTTLGWKPRQVGLIEDIDRPDYYG